MKLERHGKGPQTFLGIHGWAGSRHTFRRVIRHMPESASFYGCDLPGYGDTQRPERLDRDAVMAAIIEAMGEIADPNLTLVGNCGGALLALEALRLAPDYGTRAVLIDPFAYPPLYFRIFTWGSFGRYAYLTTFANPLGRLFTNGALRRNRTGTTNLTSAFRAVDHDVALDYIRLLCSFEHASRFAGMQNPVDIVFGERTFAAIRRSLPIWREVLPNLRCTELRGAGHEPIREATEQLAEVIFETAPTTSASPAAEASC